MEFSGGGDLNRFKMQGLLEDYQELHSEFQIENFIVGNQGDRWAQYKQCLREIKARNETIISDTIQLKIIESSRKHKMFSWLKKIGRHKIEIKGAIGVDKFTALKNTIKERERELECFFKIAKKLKEEIGEITEEKRYQLESESWKNKGIKLAAIDFLCSGRLSPQTAEFILSLPKDSQVEIFTKISENKPFKLLGLDEAKIEAKTDSYN